MKTHNISFIILIILMISSVAFSKTGSEEDQKLNLKSGAGIFDKVQWEKISEKSGITLFMQKNKDERINFYKAEKTFNSNQGEIFFNNLIDFEKYTKIFPKTIIYKKIKEISKNKYLIYSLLDFNPFKNRDYYTVIEYSYENKNNIKEWTIEWYPSENFPEIKDVERVKNIYGRWKILEINGNVKLSVEYYNDFNLPVAKFVSAPFEKSSTIDAVNRIINFTNQ